MVAVISGFVHRWMIFASINSRQTVVDAILNNSRTHLNVSFWNKNNICWNNLCHSHSLLKKKKKNQKNPWKERERTDLANCNSTGPHQSFACGTDFSPPTSPPHFSTYKNIFKYCISSSWLSTTYCQMLMFLCCSFKFRLSRRT